MKVVILAGGLGSRLGDITENIPKPMVFVKDKPLIFHIMEIYSQYGFKDFIVALGYKSQIIKDYFLNFNTNHSDIEIFLKDDSVKFLENYKRDWNITLVDTGINTLTGARLKKLEKYLSHDRQFMLTYGDGLSNVNIDKLLKFHNINNKIATVTAVRPPARFGELYIQDERVLSFKEKPQLQKGWINGGYFIFQKKIFDYLDINQNLMLEKEPMTKLIDEGQLNAYKHEDFWQCIDTKRDLESIQNLSNESKLPWLKK